MSKKIINSNSFQGGLVTLNPGHLLDDGASPSNQNVDFSTSLGRLTKRKGYSNYVTANIGSTPVTGLYEYIKADGTTVLYAVVQDDIYEIANPSTWTSRLNNATVDIGEANFATFDNLCIAVSPNITTSKSTGGAFSSLLGSPPSNVKYIETHKGRVFMANSSAGKSRLHFCFLNEPEDWTTIAGETTDAGFIDVGLDDGDQITGIKSIGNVLLVFKTTSTWAVFGSNPLDFKVRKISPTVGCCANKTIIACDTFAIFLANTGVYAANSDGVTMLSYNIKPTIDTWTSTQRSTACAGRLNTQYWLAIDSDSNSLPDVVYYLDYVYGVWGYYTNKKENVFYTRRDGTLLSGGSDTDVIRKHNDTDNDNGSAISMIWDTPDYDFDDWVAVKNCLDIIVSAYPITGKTLTISHIVDGITSATTISMSLTPPSTQDKVFLVKRHQPSTSYGRFIRYRFTNNETSAPIQVFAYSIGGNLSERQNG
jgi:hypothetical protein